MQKITAIILDVGGVLIQTKDTTARKAWEEKLHLIPGQLTKEVFEMQPGELATIGKVTDDTIWENIKEKFALSSEDIHQLRHDFFIGDRLNIQLYEYIQSIRQAYRTVILSNAWLNAREIYTNHYHLDKIVDSMILSAEEGMRKPTEQLFVLTLDRLQKNPTEVLFIDDNTSNIKAANQLGIQTIYFTNTHDVIEKIRLFDEAE